MSQNDISFTSFNLLNLNEPGEPIYNDTDGWDATIYDRKIDWTARILNVMNADVFGFQELWHRKSIETAFTSAGLAGDYTLLVPPGHLGQKIVCAGAVKTEMLVGDPEWIDEFPDTFKLQSGGDDAQTGDISVAIDSFSRPVLHFRIKPKSTAPEIHVYVCHFKSKGPTAIFREGWYRDDRDKYSKHSEAIGSALSTIRRTAEAMALRMILTEQMKKTDTPVVVLGDCNDGQHSNTLNIMTSQPRFLHALSTGVATLICTRPRRCNNIGASPTSITPTSITIPGSHLIISWCRRNSTTTAASESGRSRDWKFTMITSMKIITKYLARVTTVSCGRDLNTSLRRGRTMSVV